MFKFNFNCNRVILLFFLIFCMYIIMVKKYKNNRFITKKRKNIKNKTNKYQKKHKNILGGGDNDKYYTSDINILFKINLNNNLSLEKKNIKSLLNLPKKNYQDLFLNLEDINEHYDYIRELSLKNNWIFFNNPTYYGSCFYVIKNSKNKNVHRLKKGIKISDVMKSWQNESLKLECRVAMIIFYLLKIYRLYGDDIDYIIKSLTCVECNDNLSSFTVKNLDNNNFFYDYDHKYYLPQKNIIETMNLLKNIDPCHCMYIRGQFGYLSLNKLTSLGVKYNIETSSQGYNLVYLSKNSLGTFSRINKNANYISSNKDKAAYLKWGYDKKCDNNLDNWFQKCIENGLNGIISNNQKKIKEMPKTYKINNKIYNYDDWYGIYFTYKVSYLLPNNYKN